MGVPSTAADLGGETFFAVCIITCGLLAWCGVGEGENVVLAF